MSQTKKVEQAPPEPRRPGVPRLETMAERMAFLEGLKRGADAGSAFDELAKENVALHQTLNEAKLLHDQLSEKLDALCAPEQYPAVITAVHGVDSRKVEVFAANFTVEVAVHPDVPEERLRIGARGLLTRERNCLVEVDGMCPRWHEVGTFEGLDGSPTRLLLRHLEHLVVVTASDELSKTALQKGDLVGFDVGSRLAYARVQPPGAEDLFFEDTPSDRFDELGGLDRQITLLSDAVLFNLMHPDKAARYRLPERQGILLVGPPGNGKTKLVRCLARFIAEQTPGGKCRFMAISGSSDYSMYLGQSEQRIIARFDAARKLALADGRPVVIFFDEIDAIGRRRGMDYGSTAPDRILSTILSQIDGIQQIRHLFVVGATNRADVLDPGLTRPGRFGNIVHIPPPNRTGARAILQRYLSQDLPVAGDRNELVETLLSCIYSPNGPYSALAQVKLRDGRQMAVSGRDIVSGAILEDFVRSACVTAAKREVETGLEGVTEDDLFTALDGAIGNVTRLLTPANVRCYLSRLPQDVDPVAVDILHRISTGTR